MPIEKVLRAFAEENFDEDHYYPVCHGQTAMIKPLGIVVKKPRSIYKRPFGKSKFIVIAVLNDYVVKEKRQEFTETVNSTLKKEILEIEEDENPEIEEEEEGEGTWAASHVYVRLEPAKYFKVNVKVVDDLGELELGKLDQEYFKDPDLRELLAQTALDANRMEGLEDQKLRLIYSVIYSERFLLKGKRQHEVVVDAGVNVVKFLTKHAQLKAQYKKTIISPKAATRNTRGPVFFKFVRVEYDKENGRLKLSDGEFAGRLVNAEERGGEKDKAEYAETVVEMEKEDIDFPESLTGEDIKKLEKIMETVLKTEKSREKRKERVKKYLNWFEEALMKEQQKISVDKPLTDEDCKFLERICCPALPNQSIVDLSPFDTEKIQGYAIVLKQIDDLSDEHWDEIEKAWAQPGQNE
ncbi:uncharacterized protein LOC144642850 [Oculina patagonica]